MADSNKLEPITLPSWPACDDCMAWSEDDLAVGCSEVIHMLTPKRGSSTRDVSGHSQWHLSTFRVNSFDETEWPYQILASISHFSIGEEQGNSNVVALAWSPLGLGMHKRSVLAVLTSNLILSLWETDGSLGQYKRTCVINKFLDPDVENPGFGPDRRKLRIRAFAWISPLQIEKFEENHVHHLVVADDIPSLIILRVSKTSSGQYGCWSVDKVIQMPLPTKEIFPNNNSISALQRRLQRQAPITRIIPGEWCLNEVPASTEKTQTLMSTLKIVRGRATQDLDFSATINARTRQADTTQETNGGPKLELRMSAGVQAVSPTSMNAAGSDSATPDIKPLAPFKQALQPIYAKFDHEHQLDGHHRTRLWGTANSRDGKAAAACISLHGSDMIEHTIPSAERITVVFRKLGSLNEQIPLSTSHEEVQHRIVAFVMLSIANGLMTESMLDKSICGIHNHIANSLQADITGQTKDNDSTGSNANLDTLATSAHAVQPSESSVSNTAVVFQDPAAPEICEICNAEIPFLGDTTSAMCRAGHQLTRCNLSFVSIQEPGISKYCSGCGKQFLDLAKLGSCEGPSLSRALFDTFQVCPYCQAKFRG